MTLPKALDIGNAFVAHEQIDGIVFEHNDYVKVIDGPYVGHKGNLYRRI
jgi:transcription antitermination factor NusG